MIPKNSKIVSRIADLIKNHSLVLKINPMFLSKEEKEKRVIDLYYNQGKTFRDIAKELRMSPNAITAILKKEEEKKNSTVTNNQQQSSSLLATKAYELFSKDKRPVEVAISLSLREPEATKLYREYWKLKRMHILNSIYKETNGELGPFLKLYKELITERGMSIEKVVNAVDIAGNKLPHMESLYEQVKEQVDNMQRTRQRLVNDIQNREYKISILDKTAFSCEQECKRIKQELQELIDKKDRIEKLIANILNNDNEGYSKLKQMVKENVKAVLSENKQVISIAFAALIQTLKADPQMIKSICNIPTGNHSEGEQHKDNNNNIDKYLESNKNRILDLVEKNYENILQVLTKNAIDTVSFNPILSSLQSSSKFPNLSNQSDKNRIEEPDIYHNSKGDIAD
jgi:predicted transcriptional regulator